MNKTLRRRADGLSLVEAIACLAILAAVAIPITAALAAIGQGPAERQARTSAATALESAMERICAMDFDDIPLSPDPQTPANLSIMVNVDGKPMAVEVYVTAHGFIEKAEWKHTAVSMDDELASLTPAEPWRLAAKQNVGVIPDPNVKHVRVVLMGMELATLLARLPGLWQAGGPDVGQGVTPEPEPSGQRGRKYRGCMKPDRGKGRQKWIKWIKKQKKGRH